MAVKREANIPSSKEGSNRWSIDYLLLDHNGCPTFVEVKRSEDTRIRREVVGQMLDYAANAQKYWPTEQIKDFLLEGYGGIEQINEELLNQFEYEDLPDAFDLENFWDIVEDNLRNGRVRLLFVADEIPSELRRIIEFLNEHMPLVEVLGVEIRQYSNNEIQAMVPRIIGQTETARQKKWSSGKKTEKLTKEKFLDACTDENAKNFINHLITEAEKQGFNIEWKTSSAIIKIRDFDLNIFYCYLPGGASSVPEFHVYLEYVKRYFDDQEEINRIEDNFLKQFSFSRSGKHTLKIPLDESGVIELKTKLNQIFDIAKDIADKIREKDELT